MMLKSPSGCQKLPALISRCVAGCLKIRESGYTKIPNGFQLAFPWTKYDRLNTSCMSFWDNTRIDHQWSSSCWLHIAWSISPWYPHKNAEYKSFNQPACLNISTCVSVYWIIESWSKNSKIRYIYIYIHIPTPNILRSYSWLFIHVCVCVPDLKYKLNGYGSPAFQHPSPSHDFLHSPTKNTKTSIKKNSFWTTPMKKIQWHKSL